MQHDILALTWAAAAIGATHTLLGPDHYLPFAVLARTRGWSATRTALVTVLCGVGHVLSSVVLGLVGILAGVMVGRLEALESVRGDLAAWLLLAFGVSYALWGLWRWHHPGKHSHLHVHAGQVHLHPHGHGGQGEHEPARIDHTRAHAHGAAQLPARDRTFWVLFLIFVFGPCEPLIPLLMYPAAESDLSGAVLVATVFSLATVGTMLAVVLALYFGSLRIRLGRLERAAHFAAGLAISASAGAILFLGL